MKKNMDASDGLQRLIKKHKRLFRIPENLNFYSEEDYLTAERKYLKFMLLNGQVVDADLGKGACCNGLS